MKTNIVFGFKGKDQAPWFMVIKEYINDNEVTYAEVLFEFWPRYFKNKWLRSRNHVP